MIAQPIKYLNFKTEYDQYALIFTTDFTNAIYNKTANFWKFNKPCPPEYCIRRSNNKQLNTTFSMKINWYYYNHQPGYSYITLLHDKDTHINYSWYIFLIYSKASGWQKGLKCFIPPIHYMNKYLIKRDLFYKPLCPKTTRKLVFIHKCLFLK